MDEAWTWGLLATIAVLVAGSMIGVAPAVIDRTSALGWWLVILSPLPLVAWNILWVSMTDSPHGVRRPVSIVIGALAGAVFLFGVTELLKKPALAQSGARSVVEAQNNSGIFAPGNCGIIAPNNQGTITQNQGPPRSPLGLYQNGQPVGMVASFAIKPDGNEVIFVNPRLVGGMIDKNANLEFQDYIVS